MKPAISSECWEKMYSDYESPPLHNNRDLFNENYNQKVSNEAVYQPVKFMHINVNKTLKNAMDFRSSAPNFDHWVGEEAKR